MPRPRGLPKTGGRAVGVKNVATRLREQALREAIIASALTPEQVEELTPLSVMQAIMRERFRAGDHHGALAAAEACAPYCHSRLSSTDLHVTGSLATRTDEEIAAERQEIAAKLEASRTVN